MTPYAGYKLIRKYLNIKKASTTAFPEHVRTRMILFRQPLALALNNALDHERLQRLAAIDPLTGLYNRRFGMARLHEEFSRAVR